MSCCGNKPPTCISSTAMFASALFNSGVLLPLHGDPEELRMGCSSGGSMEHKYRLHA